MKIKKAFNGIISFALSCAIILSIAGLSVSAKTESKNYPCVFVHGLLGWGEEADIYESNPYWGMGSEEGDLITSLNNRGYTCYAASVGALSSTWDRACELYAQLAGTVVDYGEAHSKAHNHSRYGKSYENAAVIDGFGKTKINLFGHSFGGNTIRLFAYIMANGDKDEIAASSDTSAFFKGGKSDWINSINTLNAPLNGSVIADFVYSIYIPMYLIGIISNVLGATGTTALDARFYQFGLSTIPGETPVELNLENISNFINSDDNAIFDLRMGACADLNKKVDIVDSIYYFSYSCCGTKDFIGFQVPTDKIGLSMAGGSLIIGLSKGLTVGGIEITDDWLPNDGMVPVISALYPLDEKHTSHSHSTTNYESGTWYIMPTYEGNHGTLISSGLDNFIEFYTSHIDLLNSL